MQDQLYIPDRGDIVKIDFDPSLGNEQNGRRPAVILSKQNFNEFTGLCILAPITSKVKGFNFEVHLSGQKIFGVVLADHVKSFSWKARNVEYVEKISEDSLEEVLGKVRSILK